MEDTFQKSNNNFDKSFGYELQSNSFNNTNLTKSVLVTVFPEVDLKFSLSFSFGLYKSDRDAILVLNLLI